ncbi:MAG: hypothetical protein AAFV62_06250 [Pseudomonadota bacterium]
MSRTGWIIANAALAGVAIASGWFALNGAQLASPGLQQLAPVQLAAETPPLPPAPFVYRELNAHAGLSGRPLFQAVEAPRFVAAASALREPITPPALPPGQELSQAPDPRSTEDKVASITEPQLHPTPPREPTVVRRKIPPIARTVLDDPRYGPQAAAEAGGETAPSVPNADEPTRAFAAMASLENGQDFGGHLMSPEARDSDTEALDFGPGLAPLAALSPKPNPQRPDETVEPVEPEASDTPPPTEEPDQAPLATLPDGSIDFDAARGPGIAPETALLPRLSVRPRIVLAEPDTVRPADDGTAPGPAPGSTTTASLGEEAITDNADIELRELVLLSVFQSRDAERALVRTAQKEIIRLEKGDEILGWRVSLIGDDHVQLSKQSRTRRLTLPKRN